MIKFILFAMAAIAIVVLGVLLDAQSQTPTPLRTNAPIPKLVFAPGRVEGLTQDVELRPQTRGQIVSIHVTEGQIVEAGALLVQLDARQYEHELTLAKSELALAEAEKLRLENGARSFEREEAQSLHDSKLAELDLALSARDRVRKLKTGSAVSQQEVDENESRVKSLTAQLQAAKSRVESLEAPARADELQMATAKIAVAQSRIELAKVTLDRLSLRAPAAGQILKIHAEPGELTGPESLEPTIILADTSRYRVRAFIDELDAPRIKTGMKARIAADGLPDTSYTGKVVRLSPRMSSKQIWSDEPGERIDTKSREIWIEVDTASDLVLGLRVDVMIDTAGSTAVTAAAE